MTGNGNTRNQKRTKLSVNPGKLTLATGQNVHTRKNILYTN